MTCTSGVFISDIKGSPSSADANSVFVACTSQQCDASILQPSKPCSMTSSVLVLFLFLSFVFMSQLWKRARAHTDAVLSVSCIFKLFIFYRYCFSLSYAVTVVGLFIMTRDFIISRVVFRSYLIVCPYFILGPSVFSACGSSTDASRGFSFSLKAYLSIAAPLHFPVCKFSVSYFAFLFVLVAASKLSTNLSSPELQL